MRTVVFLLALVTVSVFADADHLLLSEICVTPTAGEFIEIFNPTAASIDLEDYLLCDVYGDSNSVEYFYPQLPVGPLTQSSSDFVASFPESQTISPGEYVVIAIDGDGFNTTYGFSADYDLRGTGGGATPMTTPTNGYIGSSAGLTNGDELVTLFFYLGVGWDDRTDTEGFCYDVDYAFWGDNTTRRIDKTGIVVSDETDWYAAYLPDIPVESQDGIATGSHPSGSSFQRIDMTEGTEILIGGNGVTDHNETSENLSATWTSATATPGGAFTALERDTWGAIKATF